MQYNSLIKSIGLYCKASAYMNKSEKISTEHGLKMATILCLIYSGITIELRTTFNESISSDDTPTQDTFYTDLHIL